MICGSLAVLAFLERGIKFFDHVLRLLCVGQTGVLVLFGDLQPRLGFLFEGKHYRSLSAIAKLITGAVWSGYRWFGLSPDH